VSSRPPIGIEAVLERAGSAWIHADVTGYDGDQVLLSVRTEIAAEAAMLIAEATLVWTTERGIFRAPVAVAADGARWRVRLRAPATRTQRREYVRLPMEAQMTLAHGGGIVRGTLVDLSEAALRIRIPSADAPSLHAGGEVRAAFTLHHTGFMLRGTVLREQSSDEIGTVDVVVMLDIPARTANDLRRTVVFAQLQRQADLEATATDETRQDLP
jgi:hypothetical protein